MTRSATPVRAPNNLFEQARRWTFVLVLQTGFFALAMTPGRCQQVVDKTPPFKIGSKFSRGLQKYSGITFFSEKIGNTIAGAALRHRTGGSVKVRMRLYSLTDLVAGKVKSLDVSLQEPQLKGLAISGLDIKTDTPLWYHYRRGKGKKTGIDAPTLIAVKARLTQADVEKALNSKEIAASLRGLKLDLPGLDDQQLSVLQPRVSIVDGKILLKAVLNVEGADPADGIPITIIAKPVLEGDSRIVMSELDVQGEGITDPEKFSEFAKQLLNPLVDLARLDRRDHAFRLTNITIDESGVAGDGKLLLAPRP